VVLDIWYGAFVPAGTPAAIIGRLNAEMNKAMADGTNRANLLQTANEPVGGTAEAFGALVREDSDKYARLVRQLDIRAS
jgi:tripartite-type tricarboxylate transporter receptor subunit TctC